MKEKLFSCIGRHTASTELTKRLVFDAEGAADSNSDRASAKAEIEEAKTEAKEGKEGHKETQNQLKDLKTQVEDPEFKKYSTALKYISDYMNTTGVEYLKKHTADGSINSPERFSNAVNQLFEAVLSQTKFPQPQKEFVQYDILVQGVPYSIVFKKDGKIKLPNNNHQALAKNILKEKNSAPDNKMASR